MTSLPDGDDGRWQRACPRADVADGDLLEVELDGGDLVLLLGVEGRVHAVAADCPHQDTPLSEGGLDGTTLTCPVHFWQWDVTTGEAMGVAELPLPCFQVEERDGDIYVKRATTH